MTGLAMRIRGRAGTFSCRWLFALMAIQPCLCRSAYATSPFIRATLGSVLLDRLVDVANHDLRDTHYVEDRLSLNVTSTFAHFFIDGIERSEPEFAAASHRPGVDEYLRMDGDALPMRSGRFWNLQFNYSLSASYPIIPGVKTTAEIDLFDVEEYACINAGQLREIMGRQAPVPLGSSSSGYRSVAIRSVGNQTISIVFVGPSDGPGCLNYIGVLQH